MIPVRCAVIGVGMVGSDHARILAACAEADLAACCDTDPSRQESVPEGVEFLTDLDATLATPDLAAVFVCTPQHLHRPIVEPALARGLAVFCEKPMASTLEDADAMIRAAAASSGVLVIGHTLRFSPDYLAVHEAVSGGEIGTVVHMAARWNAPDFEGRIISGRTTVPQEMMIHDIDIMRWLAGDVERVYAEPYRSPVTGPGPDAMVATLRFRSGAVGVLDHNWIMPTASGLESDHRLAVFGSAGSAFAEFRDAPAVVFGPGSPSVKRTTYHSHPAGIPYGAMPTEDRYFLTSVRDGRPWPITLADARAAVACALALDESARTGEPVTVA
ncbi:MAG TPA: Gfo/Idh/MocA family oxidoreductase [Streptosporangiaceae bacterium]|nr:Gfo/Idh/MocA family oxidoreductase [Streptosporangiaceae bacterium]